MSKFKVGDVVTPKSKYNDRNHYEIDAIEDGGLRFVKWEHHGWFDEDNFELVALLETPLFKALE